jgi:ketosteroid isomerase-like protein
MYDALNAQDIERFGRFVSDEPDVPVVIGTGGTDWDVGKPAILEMLALQVRDSPGLRFEPGEMRCHEEGDVAWVTERPTLIVPEQGRVVARHTAVLRRENGEWRLVSSHLSLPEVEEP